MAFADKVWKAIAWKLPRRLIYWCFIRVGAHGTTGAYGNTVVGSEGTQFLELLKRWGE